MHLDTGDADDDAPACWTIAAVDGQETEVSLDRYGILRYGRRWIALAPAEMSAMEVLLNYFGNVVTRRALSRELWPEEDPDRRTIDVLIYRLRKRIEPFGFVVATIRGRGFLLGWAGPTAA